MAYVGNLAGQPNVFTSAPAAFGLPTPLPIDAVRI